MDQKAKVPYNLELTTINNGTFEVTIFIKSIWNPNDKRPGVENFLEYVEVSEIRCYKCKSNFVRDRYNNKICGNPECVNSESYTESDLENYEEESIAQFNGMVRNKYNFYWEMYKAEYSAHLSN